MGEITRLHAADIVPFAPNDATDVSNELNNIVGPGVNDNYNAQTATVYDGGAEDISVVHNANRVLATETRLDLLDPASPDGRVSVNEDAIDALEAADIVIEGRLDDLENRTFAEIDVAAYTLATGDERRLRVVYSSNCTITIPNADGFDLGETFTITVEGDPSRYVHVIMADTYGNYITNLYLTEYDSLKLICCKFDSGGATKWNYQITPVPAPSIVWTPTVGATNTITTSLYPDRVAGIWIPPSTSATTVVMPLLLYVYDRGYSWVLDIDTSSGGDVYIKEHASDGGGNIIHIEDGESWAGNVVAGSAASYYPLGTLLVP